MEKEKSKEDLITLLKNLPESQNKIDSDAGKMIADIIAGMKEGRLLENGESIFEITLRDGEYICSLDAKHRLKQVYLLKDIL
ncbi:hypothetical protein POZ03_01110 [Bacteroides uniformis]|uniref:hypothetical protein n=1 Tax=Bacteroides uniformis TaxID=820 RepID=UPI00233F3C3E|nr:hypothetical protein [Bacteroides uniformis]MDC1809056.1 hypothetical protein [Bacteroides uniformis]